MKKIETYLGKERIIPNLGDRIVAAGVPGVALEQTFDG